MSKYISVEWLEENEPIFDSSVDEAWFRIALNSAPSIDIVRCGECKHWTDNEDYDCEIHSGAWQADDSCSYGERSSE